MGDHKAEEKKDYERAAFILHSMFHRLDVTKLQKALEEDDARERELKNELRNTPPSDFNAKISRDGYNKFKPVLEELIGYRSVDIDGMPAVPQLVPFEAIFSKSKLAIDYAKRLREGNGNAIDLSALDEIRGKPIRVWETLQELRFSDVCVEAPLAARLEGALEGLRALRSERAFRFSVTKKDDGLARFHIEDPEDAYDGLVWTCLNAQDSSGSFDKPNVT